MNNFKISFIRHGKTEANEKRLYCGKSDLSLSDNGKKELKEILQVKSYPKYSKYYTSGAKRANETFEIIYGKEAYEKINEFWEYDFGDFEMKSYEMLKEDISYVKWIEDIDGEVSCPNGENKKNYRVRISKAFTKFLKKLDEENIESALILCHGGTIGTLLEIFGEVEGNFYSLQPKCGFGYETEVIFEKDNIKIKILNNIPKERG